MIEKALRYIVDMAKPMINEIGGQKYSDKQLYRIAHNPKADPIEMNTLTSLVEYIRSGTDRMADKMILQVESPHRVSLFSMLDSDRVREKMAVVKAEIPSFNYGGYMGHEEFMIALQSKFLPGSDRDLLMKFAGTVENGTISEYGDDGITQKATVRTGIASKGAAIVPNPVCLCPFRTFTEVEQPDSLFIFRMKDRDGSVCCAIFEADGGAWKNKAMENVKSYLKKELSDVAKLTIIS